VAVAHFLIWIPVGALVMAIGGGWASVCMRSEFFSRAVPALSGGLVILAGGFQFSRWKWRGLCLRPGLRSQGPITLSYGLRKGLCGAICCTGFVVTLLSLGMMNIRVILGLATLIALETYVRTPRGVTRFAGGLFVLAGSVILMTQV